MPITLVQSSVRVAMASDTTCISTASLNSVSTGLSATIGGSSGSSLYNFGQDSNAIQKFTFTFLSESTTPQSTRWEASTWSFGLEVTTANMNVDWTGIAVAPRSAIGSTCYGASTLSINLGVAGVKTFEWAGPAGSLGTLTTDQFNINYLFTNAGVTMAAGIVAKLSQDITTGINSSGAGGAAVPQAWALSLIGVQH